MNGDRLKAINRSLIVLWPELLANRQSTLLSAIQIKTANALRTGIIVDRLDKQYLIQSEQETAAVGAAHNNTIDHTYNYIFNVTVTGEPHYQSIDFGGGDGGTGGVSGNRGGGGIGGIGGTRGGSVVSAGVGGGGGSTVTGVGVVVGGGTVTGVYVAGVETYVGNDTSSLTDKPEIINNYWALLALLLVFATAAGNILVCLAIGWERRLQNVTNYFLMSLAITDLMVAILVMPLGILTLVKGHFPLASEHCLAWICLDVLFCTASIMHLCTISVDRYLSLRYPMRFGRNKTRRRVVLKIIFVWLLSIAMSLPLSLMYSKDHASVLVDGTCQIPDPVYKLVGSIVCFYIPLGVMLLTYCLTVRLLAQQQLNLGGLPGTGNSGWASSWLAQTPALERRFTSRRKMKPSLPSTPNHAHSATSTDTELSTLDTHELWLPESSIAEPTPSTMTALHHFGAEMVKLSRRLETAAPFSEVKADTNVNATGQSDLAIFSQSSNCKTFKTPPSNFKRLNYVKSRRASASAWSKASPPQRRKRFSSFPQWGAPDDSSSCCQIDELFFSELDKRKKRKQHQLKNDRNNCDGARESLALPPPCTCRYFGESSVQQPSDEHIQPTASAKIISTVTQTTTGHKFPRPAGTATIVSTATTATTPATVSDPLLVVQTNRLPYTKTSSVVTWDSRRNIRRGSSCSSARTSLLAPGTAIHTRNQFVSSTLRRSATLRHHSNIINSASSEQGHSSGGGSAAGGGSGGKNNVSSPCLLQRATTVRSHHSRNSSVISRNSSRHGRIIRLEQKATKVLGVVFFTFVILWAPFFVLNLLPTVCEKCEHQISHWVFDVVTWLGYASSMVNPIFYTIFNKVFRQAFKKVLTCKYGQTQWRPQR